MLSIDRVQLLQTSFRNRSNFVCPTVAHNYKDFASCRKKTEKSSMLDPSLHEKHVTWLCISFLITMFHSNGKRHKNLKSHVNELLLLSRRKEGLTPFYYIALHSFRLLKSSVIFTIIMFPETIININQNSLQTDSVIWIRDFNLLMLPSLWENLKFIVFPGHIFPINWGMCSYLGQ